MFLNLSQTVSTADAEPAVVAPIFSYLEGMAITIGMREGWIARRRSRFANLLVFSAHPKPLRLANRRLEALRAYAELACALFPRRLSTTSLEDAGFDGSQRRELLELIGVEYDRRSLQK